MFRALLNQPLPHGQAWRLAWPMILANISTPLIGLADTAMLGHLDSPRYLGAVAVGANVLSLFFWMFAFLRMGTTSLTGQALGAKDENAISNQLVQGSLIALALGGSLILLQGLVLPLALGLMVPDSDLYELSYDYAKIRIYSAPAVFVTYVIVGWFVGLQNAFIPLCVTVLANLINLALDYLFIVHFGWASRGAAIASLIAEYSTLAFCLLAVHQFYRRKDRSLVNVLLQSKRFMWKKLFQVNTDLFIRTTVLLLVFNFFVAQSAKQGEILLAANAILLQLILFTSFALDGYAHAAETMTAHAVGAKDRGRFYSSCAAAGIAAGGIAAIFSLAYILLGQQLVNLIVVQKEVQDEALNFLLWLSLMPLVSVFCYTLDGIFIGAGQTRIMRNLMLVSVILVFYPLWVFSRGMGNHGLWFAFTIFNLSRGVLLALAFYQLSLKTRWFRLVNKEQTL